MELKETANNLNGTMAEIENALLVGEEELTDVIQLVSFALEDVEYGVDILHVYEIQKIHQIAHLPNSPDFIKGILNLRGDVIPVVDLRIRFGLEVAEPTEFSRIIIIETNNKKIGLLVDNVRKVIRVPEANVSPPSDIITDLSEEFIQGIGRLQDSLIIILNITNIAAAEDEKAVVSIEA
ncbi:MAG: chemotaxis protein CheW [Leptospirales bacterium]|nr:chemotaxis protein CheW [Leptospirales bacterium]